MDDHVTVTELIQKIADDFCSRYCKYPDIFDEDKEGCELSESAICANCPMSRLC